MHPHEFQERKLLSTEQAAEYCGSTSSTLEKYRVYGGGARFIKLGRLVKYDVRDLDEWLDGLKRSSTSDTPEAA